MADEQQLQPISLHGWRRYFRRQLNFSTTLAA